MRVPLPSASIAPLAVLALAVAVLAPPAQAHGLVNAGELETLILQDEASDVVTGLDLGFDLVQVYVGEAHVPGLGDGLYVHTVLYGGAGERPALDGPLSVRFEFGFGSKSVEHTLHLQDRAFQGTFDQIDFELGDGEAEVQRAFFVYPDGVGPGTSLTSLRATSYVGQEARDVAPGGIFLPGAGAEVPMGDSEQVVDSYVLKGPIGYLEADLAAADGAFLVQARNPLKQGDQHILLLLPDDLGAWTADVQGGGEVKAGGNTTFQVRLAPNGATTPLRLDLVTDIGGHLPLEAVPDGDGGIVLRSASDDAVLAPAAVQESPNPLAVGLLALAGAALLARKAQR